MEDSWLESYLNGSFEGSYGRCGKLETSNVGMLKTQRPVETHGSSISCGHEAKVTLHGTRSTLNVNQHSFLPELFFFLTDKN